MHPRNPYKDKPPDFKALAIEYPEFRKFCQYVSNGKVLFDFRKDAAVRCLTQTLLKKDFDLDVRLPSGHLVPRVPQKLNYCLLVDDLLTANRLTENVVGIDIGTGTSCIHALVGARRFGWKFVATDGDERSVRAAHENVERNGLGDQICVVHVNPDVRTVLMDVLNTMPGTQFDFCMCNPPFFEKNEKEERFCEEPSVSDSCYSNRVDSVERTAPHSTTFASEAELYVEGGEVAFVNRIIDDSVCLRERVRIYTTMLGRKQSMKLLEKRLQRFGDDVKFTFFPLNQGKTKRWMLAWTFAKNIVLNEINQDRPVTIECPKPGAVRLTQQVALLNGNCRREESGSLVVEFRSVTWTNQRARRRADAELMRNGAKRTKLNTSNAACQASLGVGDGRDSFTNAGNFVCSESVPNGTQWDNCSQAYFPLPAGTIPRPIVRIRVSTTVGKSTDLLSFEIISGSKHHLFQLVQYLRNAMCR